MTVNEKTAVKLGSYDLQRLMVKIKMNKTRSIPVTISETVDNNSDKDEEAPDNSKSTKTHKKFTCKQKIALVILAIVDFMSFCSMSIMAPFYPQEAATKGMSESLAGFVFGFYALVIFLSSPVFGKTLPRIGLNCLFTGGVLLSGLCSLVFGTLNLIENYTLFTTLSFVIRGLGALGSSAYSTASYVIIVNVFPEHAGAVRGLLETFVGLGMSVGPALGGLLFAEDWGLRFAILCDRISDNFDSAAQRLSAAFFGTMLSGDKDRILHENDEDTVPGGHLLHNRGDRDDLELPGSHPGAPSEKVQTQSRKHRSDLLAVVGDVWDL